MISNLNKVPDSLFSGLKSWRGTIYVSILALCFLLFQQGDLAHTTVSSYAYLAGHFSDFYDFNKHPMGANDYLFLTYAIFAIWNIPIYVLGLTSDPELWRAISPLEVAWAKLLLVVFFIASVKLMEKISELLNTEADAAQSSAASIFATSPIAIFAVFIFSQYDIIGVFFTLLGFYFYLKKDLVRFSWIFSVAISFKYFAFFIYVPLILIVEKRPLHIAKLLLVGLLITALQIALYSGSEVFQQRILFQPFVAAAAGRGFRTVNIPMLCIAVAYFMGCLYLYFTKFSQELKWKRMAVLTPIAAYALMFSAVTWHPQWLIITTPFFALSYAYVRNKKWLVYVDLLGMLAFIWLCVTIWPHNVDVMMVTHGILAGFIPQPLLVNVDLLPQAAFPFFKNLFYVYLFAPLLIIAAETFTKRTDKQSTIAEPLLFTRFVIGIGIFLIPTLICLLVPPSMAGKLKTNAGLDTSQFAIVGEIVDKHFIGQTFTPARNGLSGVGVHMATFARVNNGQIQMRLEDLQGRILATQTVEMRTVIDNDFLRLGFDPILDSKGKSYRVVLQAIQAAPGNAVTAWGMRENRFPGDTLTIGGRPVNGHLVMSIFFAPHVQ